LERLLFCKERNLRFDINERNSLLLYLLDLTDRFDFIQGRSDTKGGAAPDIDMDFSKAGRDRLIEHIRHLWGTDNVANIGTRGTFKPKSLTHRFFSITAPDDDIKKAAHFALRDEILKKFPPPLFGREPTLKEIVLGDPSKSYPPNLDLMNDDKYADWFDFIGALDGMPASQSVHASGMIITEFPVHMEAPTYTTKDYKRITQFDMKECESLGLIKYDFLVIKTLDVLQLAVQLIKSRHKISYDIYDIPDHDPKAYRLFARGLVTGVFQFETSKLIQEAAVTGRPESISDLSDISSLVRPGPMSAGFLTRYLERTQDPNIPKVISDKWSDTRNVLVYQEQLIKLFTEVAGLSLQEADSARRAVGKKDKKYLEKLLPAFKAGCYDYGLGETAVERLWDVIMGCSDYLFNKSHSVAYSYLSYVCAFLKANYPAEYFCALLTIGSKMMQPKIWKVKVTEYLIEAREFGLNITHPDINNSGRDFTISADGTAIHFGFNGIKNMGSVIEQILSARNKGSFTSIEDFMNRINQSKVNTKVFTALVDSGCFDSIYSDRQVLREGVDALYAYKPALLDYHTRLKDMADREKENTENEALITRRDELKHIAKLKKGRPLTDEELEFVESTKLLKRKPALAPKEKPEFPSLPATSTSKKRKKSLKDILAEGLSIGCYLDRHPARILCPEATTFNEVVEGQRFVFAASIISVKTRTTKSGSKMVSLVLEDGAASADGVMFSDACNRFVKRYGHLNILAGMIVRFSGVVKLNDRQEASDDEEEDSSAIEILIKDLEILSGE